METFSALLAFVRGILIMSMVMTKLPLCQFSIFSEDHDDFIKWKHFARYWPLCGEFTGHRWIPLTKASDGELWCFVWSVPWINGSANNHEAGDLICRGTQYEVIVMPSFEENFNPVCWLQSSFLCPNSLDILIAVIKHPVINAHWP